MDLAHNHGAHRQQGYGRSREGSESERGLNSQARARSGLLDRFGNTHKRERDTGDNDGHGGGSHRKKGSRERRNVHSQDDTVTGGGSQKASRKQVAGMFSNSVRSSVVRKGHKSGQGQRVHQKRFSESEFFRGDQEDDKENVPVREPERAQSTHRGRERAASLAFGSIDDEYDDEEEDVQPEAGEMCQEGPSASLSGKLLERKLLIQQMVASCHQPEVSEEEARLEAAAAANYRACRKIAEASLAGRGGLADEARWLQDCDRFEQGALQALAQLHDFYRLQSASPSVSHFQTPAPPPSVPRLASASRPPSHPGSARLSSVQRTLQREAQAARSMSMEAQQQQQQQQQQPRIMSAPREPVPIQPFDSAVFQPPAVAFPMSSELRLRGFAAPPQFESSRPPYGAGASVSVPWQGMPAVSSSDDTIAQSMMLPDVWTP